MLPVDGTAIIWASITLYFLLSGAMANGMIHCDWRRLGEQQVVHQTDQPGRRVDTTSAAPPLPCIVREPGLLRYPRHDSGSVILAVAFGTAAIYQEENQQDEQTLIMAVTTIFATICILA